MKETELLGEYKLVLGLEIHLHLNTEKKMFCGCSAKIWNLEPNTNTCPTCLGLPGALPVPNFEAVQKAQILGLALGCKVNNKSNFDRKHYFYPDLPKGYQISQYKYPLSENGTLELESGMIADIERVHLEEDVAKSFHQGGKTLIDFNKSGVPLVEIVSRPCFRNTTDAVDYCKQIQLIVRRLGIGEVDMEKGQMRLEANISIRTSEMEEKGILPKYKVEIKNINSFRFMEKAVHAEIIRQRSLLESGETPVQENRGFNEATAKTVPQRQKEEAHDYRYFPEPDIPPMEFDNDHIEKLRAQIPELPNQTRKRLTEKYNLSMTQSRVLVDLLGYDTIAKYEKLISDGLDPIKLANNFINKENFKNLSEEEIKQELSKKSVQVTDTSELDILVNKVIADNSKAVEDYKKGKESSIQFLIGAVMRESKGKADTAKVKEILVKKLNN